MKMLSSLQVTRPCQCNRSLPKERSTATEAQPVSEAAHRPARQPRPKAARSREETLSSPPPRRERRPLLHLEKATATFWTPVNRGAYVVAVREVEITTVRWTSWGRWLPRTGTAEETCSRPLEQLPSKRTRPSRCRSRQVT